MPRVTRVRIASAGIVLVISGMVLAGWGFALPALANPFPGITMKVNTALALAALALAMILVDAAPRSPARWIARGLTVLALVLAAANAIQYLAGTDLSIDELFVAEPVGVIGTLPPGRMAPNTAAAIIALGGAILCIRRAPRVALSLSGIAGLIGLLASVDFVFRLIAPQDPALASYRQMAFLTAVSLCALSTAVFCAMPGRAPVSVLVAAGAGGTAARRVLPAAVLIPLLLGLLRLEGQELGWYDTEFGAALFACATLFMFAAVALWSAAALQRAGEELLQTNRFLDAVVENIPNMIFVKDAVRLSFQRLNRAGETLLGVSRDDMIGKTDFDFFPSGDAEFFQEKDRQALSRGTIVDIPEEKIETAHGPRWLHTMKVPVRTESGVPDFLLGISEDITERREADRALRQAKDEAEAANRELESFSYSVSHDLRTPLRAIDGFSQALLEDYSAKLDDQGREHLARVRRAAQRMSQLIDDLIGLARVTRADLVRERVDLTAMANDIVADLRQRDPARNVTVKVEQYMAASADPRLLRALLENLLGNAWKFTSKRESATIEVLRGMEVEGAPSWIVRDDGAGFDPEYAARLFGAFQRLHRASEFEGTGIGLATVLRIARRHGGRVWALGEVGRGASFHFTLGSENHQT